MKEIADMLMVLLETLVVLWVFLAGVGVGMLFTEHFDEKERRMRREMMSRRSEWIDAE